MISALPLMSEHVAAGAAERFFSAITRVLRAYRTAIVRVGSAASGQVCQARAEESADPHDLRRKLAQAEAELATRRRSIAMTSHELRTPLNGILGMADLLVQTSLSAEQTSYVQAVRTSATALLSLVDDMLDAGKIEAGHWSPKPQPVAIEALVEEVVELLAPRAQAKGLELAAHVAAHVPEIVSADPDHLIRILTNLTGNAIKFTDHGGVAIDVSVERDDGAFVTLALRVHDSGIGISPDDQIRIFGEYEQAHAVSLSRPGGTGLGLSISRAVAQAMGGDITLESTPGSGSVFCFRVTLPVLRAASPAGRVFVGRHILLISDKTIEPPVLMRRLFDLGASVELARTLEAARAGLIAGRPVDAILYDYGESHDILDFKTIVSEPHPPIAVMVAPADRHALDRLRESGVKAHLVKPMRTGSLIKVISAMISGETAVQLSAQQLVPVKPSPVNSANILMKPTVLLADDNDINLLLGQSMLGSLGYTSDTARDGARAVARAIEAIDAARPYDIILMDLHMPEMDGFEAIAAIRNKEQSSDGRSFIIALTADITEKTSMRAIESGADLAMTKPIQKQLLVEAFEKAGLVRPKFAGVAQDR